MQLSVCVWAAVNIQRPVVGPVVDRCDNSASAVARGSGVAAAKIGSSLRRLCGKTSSKPAASIIDQLLTIVRG